MTPYPEHEAGRALEAFRIATPLRAILLLAALDILATALSLTAR